ncbi:MAG: hypothetical protein JSW51_00900 [Gemmatimonadota bacterium]|nr:MAG: hypothetical protein JSW51_00900 [Gemmatimonadota bacterium]
MTQLPEVIDLSPEEEAKRLWNGALEARKTATEDLISLCAALDLGLRSAEILTIQKLQPIKDHFPATIGVLLDTPNPEVDTHRDAISVPNSLQFTDIVDLLSAEELECVSPGMHRGWEDRRFSCRRSRVSAQEVIGVSLDANERDQLLLLAAYRNRIFRYPPPIKVNTHDVVTAFASLERLVGGLK